MPKGQFLSHNKATNMISNNFFYHIVNLRDIDFETATLKSVHIVNEFLKIFLDDLPNIPHEWEIDFVIDFLADTQPISVPPYKMALDELKELKEQLKDLFDRGFIRQSISPWGVPM